MRKFKRGSIIVLSAPSGAGKTEIYKAIIKKDKNAVLSVSYTTRKPRKTEKNSVHYFFTSQEKFKTMIEKNKFAEWAIVHNNYYGTPKLFLERSIKSGKDIILEIDVKGAQKIRKLYPQDAALIFIKAPSIAELRKRLLDRGQDSKEEIVLRMQNAAKEMKYEKFYDYVVINKDLKTAVDDVETIIKSLRHKNK